MPELNVKITTASTKTDRLVSLLVVEDRGNGWKPSVKDNLIFCATSTIKAGDYTCELVVDSDFEYLLRIVDLPCAGYKGQYELMCGNKQE